MIEQKLVDANPAVTQFQQSLAGSYINIGILQREAGNTGEALASFRTALAIQQRLADASASLRISVNRREHSY